VIRRWNNSSLSNNHAGRLTTDLGIYHATHTASIRPCFSARSGTRKATVLPELPLSWLPLLGSLTSWPLWHDLGYFRTGTGLGPGSARRPTPSTGINQWLHNPAPITYPTLALPARKRSSVDRGPTETTNDSFEPEASHLGGYGLAVTTAIPSFHSYHPLPDFSRNRKAPCCSSKAPFRHTSYASWFRITPSPDVLYLEPQVVSPFFPTFNPFRGKD